MVLFNDVRLRGRMALGCSAGLKGNGMVFVGTVGRTIRWSASLAEDVDLHLDLVDANERVIFAPEASVMGQVPARLQAAESQNQRWEAGRLRLAGKALRTILKRLPRGDFRPVEAAMEVLVPPLSVLGAALAACFLLAAALGDVVGALLALVLLAGLGGHVVLGLLVAGADRRSYMVLLGAPVLAVWKAWLYARLLITGGPKEWRRTHRDG
jgi:hypothetical protein